MIRVLSRKKPLTISLSAPLRRTMAASGEPEAVIALRKPAAIESTPTKHGDDPGDAEDRGRRPSRAAAACSASRTCVTAATCEIQLMGRP